MRTTIDLPDALYRALKVRAAQESVTMRELAGRFIEEGLGKPAAEEEDIAEIRRRRGPPVIAIPYTGVPIPALTREEYHRLEELEDLEKHARSTRR